MRPGSVLSAWLPVPCVFCGAVDRHAGVCDGCHADLPGLAIARCPVCGIATPGAQVCGACLHSPPAFTHTVAAADYAFPLDAAVVRLKYGRDLALVNALGVVLRDALTSIDVDGQSLEIAGLDFGWDRARRAASAAERIARWPGRGATPRLLLLHDPSEFALLPEGCADLVLSGHTHGGHIGVQLGRDAAITVVGLTGIPDQGVFSRGDMRLFVTRCVGFYGYPMRVGIPPEIAILVLRAPRRGLTEV